MKRHDEQKPATEQPRQQMTDEQQKVAALKIVAQFKDILRKMSKV